ncbi:SAF domain-containing protein [Arthrobacter antioxidans]|uniref:SAF domain-containing protein n=1 Tax=Arthrobacter antioxidans TaxID=2895818 RepID=UPI001FFF40EF|nr:SAF domain-containing protein [Arthrobacter antioxidans]
MSTDTRAVQLPSEAPRLRKPSWKDPRLLIGLLLVLASTAGVIALLDSQNATTQMYSAREDLAVGSRLTEEDLVAVPVRLGDSSAAYLPVADGIPDGAVATRLVTRGELVPAAAVGTTDGLGRKPVGLTVEDPLPNGAAAGDRVDVWVSLRTDTNSYEEPRLLLEAAEVAELTVGESALGASSSTLVQVLVDDDAMPELLGALSNDARIAVVLNLGAGS